MLRGVFLFVRVERVTYVAVGIRFKSENPARCLQRSRIYKASKYSFTREIYISQTN